jgi:hypothetical protein
MKGIKCNSNEVNAILAGDKSQIRLVIKPQPDNSGVYEMAMAPGIGALTNKWAIKQNGKFVKIKCPYGKIRDLVFVKESFWEYKRFKNEFRYDYDADTDYTRCLPDGFPIQRLPLGLWEVKKRPAQHMKQHQSRLTLRIKDISVERLQDISEEDCWAEGGDREHDNA